MHRRQCCSTMRLTVPYTVSATDRLIKHFATFCLAKFSQHELLDKSPLIAVIMLVLVESDLDTSSLSICGRSKNPSY